MVRAACVGQPEEWWFPRTSSESFRFTPKARAICNACPIREACIEQALADEAKPGVTHSGQRYGMFGGLTATERSELADRRAQRRGAA